MTPAITISGDTASIHFGAFGLESYDLFIRTKKLPEQTILFDKLTETYTVRTPARYAHLLDKTLKVETRPPLPLNGELFDFQAHIVSEALAAGRYGVYTDCGRGKTRIGHEVARQVIHTTRKQFLNISPNIVIDQTIEEARLVYGNDLPIVKLTTRAQLEKWLQQDGDEYGICSHHKFIEPLPEAKRLGGIDLDESSILKTGGGVIKWNLIKSTKGVPYKLSKSATPAPNDAMEFASQAAFLETIRHEGEVLWTWFTREKDGKTWRVKPHARKDFYRFLSSWSICLRNPATFGFKDGLTDIPEPHFFEYQIAPTKEQMDLALGMFHTAGAGLFGSERMGVKERSKTAQLAKGFMYNNTPSPALLGGDLGARIHSEGVQGGNPKGAPFRKGGGRGPSGRSATRIRSLKPVKVAEIIAGEVRSGLSVVCWVNHNEECRILEELMDSAGIAYVTLDGDTEDEERLEMLKAHRNGEVPVLFGKPSMIGFGMNMQHVGAMVGSCVTDSYEQFYQWIRRAYRFGQTRNLRIHLPYIPELEGLSFENVKRKDDLFEASANEQEQAYLEAMQERGLI